jgi:BirA family biotin operon repressor/biotin-[acetyl-CoA-carboxylase] ligase
MSFGNPHRHFLLTNSTNSQARELAAAGAPHGTVVTASEQTEGRGRQGRNWCAPAGKALLYSAILRPLDPRQLLALAVPLAVCEVAEELQPGVRCQIKWPNDVQIEGKKLAGILIETRPQEGWAVIGVGLNLAIETAEFPAELGASAISLNGSASAEEARTALDQHLCRWIKAEPGTVLGAWRSRDTLSGREVAWNGGSGIADGIDQRGRLIIIGPGGERLVLSAGEVHLRRS